MWFNFFHRLGARRLEKTRLHLDAKTAQTVRYDLAHDPDLAIDVRLEWPQRAHYPNIVVDGVTSRPVRIAMSMTAGWGRLICVALKKHYPAIRLLRRAWTLLETSADPRARKLAKEILVFLDQSDQ